MILGVSMSAKEAAAEDPYSLEGVPGLGPAGIKCLNKEGFYTTLQVIHKNPTFLKDVTGMDKDEAGEAFAFMKKKLAAAGKISAMERSATEILLERQNLKRIKTSCKAMNHIFNGGLECGSITEIYGENGCGKTQTAHEFAVDVQLPEDQGGLAIEGQAPPLVLYLDTENTFRPERIVSILAGKKLIPAFPQEIKTKVAESKILSPGEIAVYDDIKAKQIKEAERYLDSIIVIRVSDAYAQVQKIKEIISMVEQIPMIKLIIVDSGVALFRSEFLGRGNIKNKFDLMNEMVHDLLAIAEWNKLPVLFINQIYHSPTEQNYGADPDEPYGGNVIGHAIPYRIKMEKSGYGKHKATIKKSPYQDNDVVRFDITDAGLVDLKEKADESV
jgi:DNA repair protein RadA